MTMSATAFDRASRPGWTARWSIENMETSMGPIDAPAMTMHAIVHQGAPPTSSSSNPTIWTPSPRVMTRGSRPSVPTAPSATVTPELARLNAAHTAPTRNPVTPKRSSIQTGTATWRIPMAKSSTNTVNARLRTIGARHASRSSVNACLQSMPCDA